MTRFGIQDYEPAWLRGREAITTAHGQRLAGLVGRTLGHVWVLWDLETDEWFSDAPVLLDFGGEQVQIDHQKFDDLSITWNMTDPRRAIEDPDFQLAWRPEPTPQLQALIGAKVEGVELLEWLADRRDMAYGSIAVGFDLAPHWLTIVNVLDENGFEHRPPGADYRRHRIDGSP